MPGLSEARGRVLEQSSKCYTQDVIMTIRNGDDQALSTLPDLLHDPQGLSLQLLPSVLMTHSSWSWCMCCFFNCEDVKVKQPTYARARKEDCV